MASPSPIRRHLLLAGAAAPLLAACQALPPKAAPRTEWVRADAPFPMPPIGVPDFTGARRFNIADFGASPDDQARTGKAIAAAMAAANGAGGGTVLVPPGIWPTGKVHLKTNVNLHLAQGATLLFSPDPADYLPAVPTSWEGLECYNYSPLVYAYECDNVAITGQGRLQARLDTWKAWYARPRAHMDALVALYNMAVKNVPIGGRDMTAGQANLRPHFVQFNRCNKVLIEDIHIVDSPFWTVHLYLCRDVVARRLDIRAHGHNNDGIDPEMSQNVLIDAVTFDQGDDAVSVKSGREFDAWRIGVPAKNIVMRNCRMKNGHQLMAIGSEIAGGVENVFVDNCHFDHADSNVRSTITNLLYVKTNERRGGYVRNIHMSNVSATRIAGGVLSVETDVPCQWRTLVPTVERRLTPIEGLHVSKVRVGEAKFVCQVKGDKDLPVRDVTLDDVKVAIVSGTPVVTENLVGFVNNA